MGVVVGDCGWCGCYGMFGGCVCCGGCCDGILWWCGGWLCWVLWANFVGGVVVIVVVVCDCSGVVVSIVVGNVVGDVGVVMGNCDAVVGNIVGYCGRFWWMVWSWFWRVIVLVLCCVLWWVKIWNSLIWGMRGLIDMVWKGCESITHNHDCDLLVTMVGWGDVP